MCTNTKAVVSTIPDVMKSYATGEGFCFDKLSETETKTGKNYLCKFKTSNEFNIVISICTSRTDQ